MCFILIPKKLARFRLDKTYLFQQDGKHLAISRFTRKRDGARACLTMAHLCGGGKLERESSTKESKCHAKRAKNVHQGIQDRSGAPGRIQPEVAGPNRP